MSEKLFHKNYDNMIENHENGKLIKLEANHANFTLEFKPEEGK